MGLMVCTNLSRTSVNYSFAEYDWRVKKGPSFSEKQITPIPKSHLNRYVSAFRNFFEITGVPYLDESDFKMIDPEAKDWESIYQRPRKQAVRIPVRVLKALGEFVSDSSLCITGRLFAWSFQGCSRIRSKVGWSSKYCARNNSLNERRSRWVRGKNQNQGKVRGGPRGLSISLFLRKTGSQLGLSYSEKTQGLLPWFLDRPTVGLRIRIRIL